MALDSQSMLGQLLLSRWMTKFRRPPFLFRNLTSSLDAIEGKPREEPQRPHTPPMLNAAPNEILQDIVREREEKLRIRATGIKALRTNDEEPELASSSRKKCKVDMFECMVGIEIVPIADTNPRSRDKVEECRLTMKHYDGGQVFFDIELKHDIFVTFRELLNEEYNLYDEREMYDSYDLIMRLSFMRRDHQQRVLELVKSKFANSARFAFLEARWQGLPRCPPDNELLALRVICGPREEKLRYGLQTDIAWRQHQPEHPNAIYNRILGGNEIIKKSSIKPKNSSCTDNTKESKDFQLDYYVADKTIGFKGAYDCVLCDRREGSLARLKLHLNCHHSLIVRVEEEGKRAIIVMEGIDSQDTDTAREFAFISSQGDLKRYLDLSKDKPNPEAVELPNPNEKANETPLSRGRKSVAEILQEPAVRPKPKFEVPPPSHLRDGRQVRYHSFKSKRILKPGELLSESEDEVDADFVHLAANATLAHPHVDDEHHHHHHHHHHHRRPKSRIPKGPDFKAFAMLWRRHRAAEDPRTEFHMGDTCVRFVAQHAHVLGKKPRFVGYTRSLFRTLRSADVITEEVFEHCMREMGAAMARTRRDPSPPRDRNRDDCARCGKKCEARRGDMSWVECTNPDCNAPMAHLSCLELKTAPRHWRCRRCAIPGGGGVRLGGT